MKGCKGAPFMVRRFLGRATSPLPCHRITHSCDEPGAGVGEAVMGGG